MNRRTGYIAIEEGVPRFACGLRCSSTLIDLGAKLKWLVVEQKPQSNGGGHDD